MCLISLIFIFFIAGAIEADYISVGQAIIPLAYIILVFYKSSKKYWK